MAAFPVIAFGNISIDQLYNCSLLNIFRHTTETH